MQEIDVNNVILTKQSEMSYNFKKFFDIVKEKNINVILVNKGDKISIEKKFVFLCALAR